MVLGRAIRMTLETAPHLCIFVHRRRLRVSLLCLIFTAAADYAVCVPFHLAGRAAGKRGSAALYGSLRRHRAAVSPPQHPGAAVSDGAAHAGGTRSYSTSAGSIMPSCSPPRLTPRHSVPCAFPCTGTSGICPWKAAAGRSTTASFRCIRSSFPTFRTTGFIKQHIATHSVKPFRSCRLCGNPEFFD